MNDLFIELNILNKIRKHGAQTYPQECCGVLLGSIDKGTKNVQTILPLKNDFKGVEGTKKNRYLITPGAYKQSEVSAQENGYEILGFYHSHPDAPAKPSEFDREHAWPWFSYIIISVQKGVPNELSVWQLQEDRSKFNSVDISHKSLGG